MRALLDQFLFSHSFYETSYNALAAQTRLTATYEGDELCQKALSLTAAKLDLGDGLGALENILYAQRRAPSNSLVTLLVGDLRLHLGIPEAVQPFELLARRSGWNGSFYRLACAHLRNGYPALASCELHETLRRNAPLADRQSLALASQIAKSNDAMGWCGLSNSGHLYLGGLVATASTADLVIELDGNELSFARHKRPDRTGVLRCELKADIWHGTLLKVSLKGVPLIGSPIELRSITRAEGFVDRVAGAVTGWHWLPGEPDFRAPVIVASVGNPDQKIIQVAETILDSKENAVGLSWQRRFRFSPEELPTGTLSVRDMRGRDLYGSPLNPGGERTSARVAAARVAARFWALHPQRPIPEDDSCELSIPVYNVGPPYPTQEKEFARREMLVAIPVYRGYDATIRCIESVLRHQTSERIVVISDNSPDARIVRDLQSMAKQNLIEFRHEERNRGFPATANIALREAAAAGLDVVLLNSDTIVAAGWLTRLRSAAYSAPNIGTATPFSNSATILSYPNRTGSNSIPDVDQVDELARLFYEVNANAVVDLPTGHGFCLYVRHACLAETGLLRDDVFAQGYGEENDFCMRATHLGWRHVAATGVYVGHIEGQSFANAKADLIRRNLRTLNVLYPGYDSLIAEWEKHDPAAHYRRNVDWRRATEARQHRSAVGFITHAREGGVLRQVQARARLAEKRGEVPLILQPAKWSDSGVGCAVTTTSEFLPNLRFTKQEAALLFQFLQEMKIERLELHHFLGHDPELVANLVEFNVPVDIHLHDYSWMCPRITLTTHDNRYCGEPRLEVCAECVSDHGNNIEWKISPRELVAWTSTLFGQAREIIAPSADAARRFSRRLGLTPTISAWEPDDHVSLARTIPQMTKDRSRRVCVAGAIGFEKGYEVILGCARYAAANDIPLSFQIVGFTCDDARLLETGKVTITGRYDENEAVTLIRNQDADFGFLPALWPETWSFVLSQLWEAGLAVVAFDIGAQAERIRRTGAGLLLPINLPIGKVVDALCRVSS
ncbi:glycosyltransferase [Acidisoma sp. 7E03]